MQPPKREPLGKKHDRVAFSCEDDALDTYLKKRASPEAKKKIATPFVMADSRTSGYRVLHTILMNLICHGWSMTACHRRTKNRIYKISP